MSGALTVCSISASRSSPGLSVASSTAVTVTVCAVFHADGANVSCGGDTVTTPAGSVAIVTVTVPVGRLDSTTVYVA